MKYIEFIMMNDRKYTEKYVKNGNGSEMCRQYKLEQLICTKKNAHRYDERSDKNKNKKEESDEG